MSALPENHSFWSLLSKIIDLLWKEVTTTIGRVNIISDIVLASVVVIIFAANTFENVAIAVASIWNSEVSQYLSAADTLIAFIILLVFFIICLVFIGFSEKIKPHSK